MARNAGHRKKRKIGKRGPISKSHSFSGKKDKKKFIPKQRFEEKQPEINNYEEPDTEEMPEVDSVMQLLSTFSDARANEKEKAIDSDTSESDDSIEDIDDKTSAADSEIENDLIEQEDASEEITLEAESDDESVGDDDNDCEDSVEDPFIKHVKGNLDPSLLTSVEATPKQTNSHKLKWPVLGQLQVLIPVSTHNHSDKLGILDKTENVKPGEPPKKIFELNLRALHVKSQIIKNIKERHKETDTSKEDLTPLQSEVFSVINNYQDFFFPGRTFDNCEDVRFVYCLHVVNHVLKTRLKVIHHNQRLNRKNQVDIPDEVRDQGLVRPKVLILVPFRDSCHRIVKMIISLLFGNDKKANVVNKARFNEEFTGSELFMPKKNRKPEDFEKLFSGNVDDSFRIGLNFTKKSLKLYSDFYSSDVIIASPLGIRMLIGADGENDRDFDFLASIEMLILDQADVFLLQNWDHVLHVMNHLHMQPRESHGVDFSRVRLWALNGWTKFYRQTLLFSSVVTPELNGLFSRQCANYAGAVRVTNSVDSGSISQVLVPLPHVFRRFPSTTVVDGMEERYKTLFEDVLPQYSDMTGVLVYVPSYFDFVRIRNQMKAKDFSFVQICEYSKDGKVARARDMFFHREVRFLLYSERFHFYRRVNIKGIRHLIFYQPPTFPMFYSEICNMMQDANQTSEAKDGNQSVTVLFNKYDVHSLTGIIRTTRAAHIINAEKAVFMFTTG